jgi:tetratricopeptide (TPR) repeat protein
LLFWFINIRTAVASNLGAWTLVQSAPGISRNISIFKQVAGYQLPAVRDIRNTFVDFISAQAGNAQIPRETLKEGMDLAAGEVEKTMAAMPMDVLSGSKAMKLYNIRYSLFGAPADLRRAEELFQKLIPYAPERLELYYLGAQTRLLADDKDEALRRLGRARELNERFPDTPWFTGLVLLDTGKATSTALEQFKEGHRLGYHPAQDQLARAVQAAQALGDIAFVRDLAIEFLSRNPKDANVWSLLALAHKELGEREQAIAAASTAADLDPNLAADMNKLIESLK